MASLPAEFPWNLGGDPETAATTATAESDTFRLAQYIKGKPNVEAILDAHGVQAELLASALSQVDVDRQTSEAFGEQLDLIGAIVGQAREGLSDAAYRNAIQSKILLNRCSGTAEEIYAIFDLIIPSGVTMEITEYGNAAFRLKLSGIALSTTEADQFLKILRKARAAGVYGSLEWSLATPATTFTFDGTTAQALDNGHFSGGTT